MFNITQLARLVGLSRTTLLYYEKIGLLKGARQPNGYRAYSEADRQRLALIHQMKAGGLSLKECQACLDGRIDREALERRMEALAAEIADKRRSLALLTALAGRGDLKSWHEGLERVAPDLHRKWLVTQGFTAKDATLIALLSKDMNNHDNYMRDFLMIFAGLERWGPGTDAATRQALDALPARPASILEIGCGNGVATSVLARHSQARITAVDTDEGALDRLRARALSEGFPERVEIHCMDMADLPIKDQTYDAIWAEGSAYIIGVEHALSAWRPMLRPGGSLVFSDLVWRTEQPTETIQTYWAGEYPDMSSVAWRLDQATSAGYKVVSHFDIGQAALDAYYQPLEHRIREMRDAIECRRVLDDLDKELWAYREGRRQFGYEMFILQRV